MWPHILTCLLPLLRNLIVFSQCTIYEYQIICRHHKSFKDRLQYHSVRASPPPNVFSLCVPPVRAFTLFRLDFACLKLHQALWVAARELCGTVVLCSRAALAAQHASKIYYAGCASPIWRVGEICVCHQWSTLAKIVSINFASCCVCVYLVRVRAYQKQ